MYYITKNFNFYYKKYKNYSYLKASIGFNFAALFAG